MKGWPNTRPLKHPQLRAAPPLRRMPLIVLSADRGWGPQVPSMIASGALPADVPPDFGYVTDAAQKQAQAWLAMLVQNAQHITDTNSGHEIHKEQPQLVIDAIRQVVDASAAEAGRRRAEARSHTFEGTMSSAAGSVWRFLGAVSVTLREKASRDGNLSTDVLKEIAAYLVPESPL